MGHLLGYARVSTTDQQPQLQVDALQRAGCYRVFTETASGARADRPVLEQVLDQLRPGDTLVVWKLDRLGRSLRHLVDTVTGLADRGIGFRSLQEAIELPDDQGVAGPELVEDLGEDGPVGAGAAGGLGEDSVAAGSGEGVDLDVEVLVGGRDAGVAKQVSHTPERPTTP